jgi:hypothetical protein
MPLVGETEAALVARWGAGELTGRWLRTAAGDEVAVLFPGRPGGRAAGRGLISTTRCCCSAMAAGSAAMSKCT